jgi:hypothetical protein
MAVAAMELRDRSWRSAAVVALLFALAACEGNHPIPPGAQQIQVSATDTEVTLRPATVAAGDVYLVLDGEAISFVERKTGPDASAEPLSDDQIAEIRDGNTQDTSASGLETGNCDPGQNAAARGQLGPCGNVMLVTVRSGKYLIVVGGPERAGAASAVLTVTP